MASQTLWLNWHGEASLDNRSNLWVTPLLDYSESKLDFFSEEAQTWNSDDSYARAPLTKAS
jgi:hypothetical protein